MTDWSSLIRGVDVSHYQQQPDGDKVKADGIAYALIKCTERGTIDDRFEYNRKAVTDRNIPWIPYAFLRPDDDDAVIAKFCSAVALSNLPAALDWEAPDVPASVVERWIGGVQTRLNRTPLAYYGLYPPVPPTASIRQCPRWLPQYPGSATANPKLPPWDGRSAVADWSACWFIWQWSAAGAVAGIDTPVDVNRLSCSAAVFQSWYATGDMPGAAPPAAGPAIPPTAPTVELPIARTLQLHATGADVTALQQRLHALGYAAAADGAFGPRTRQAVIAFQTAHGLNGDGIVGPVTLHALET